MSAPLTIIGTGLAGYTLAREFRKLDKTTPLRLISLDAGYFYSKPMLSNVFVQNKTLESLKISTAENLAQQLNAEILTHCTVTKIDPATHSLQIQDTTLNYSKLVFAIGAEQIRLPLAGNAVGKIFTVNDLEDYQQFHNALQAKKRVAILGAGLIGCEFANDLQQAGFEVSLIDLAAYPLARLVPPPVGEALQQTLVKLGVKPYFSQTVASVDTFGDAYQLRLSSGQLIDADVVLSAIGLRARTQLAAAAGLNVARGIVVNRYLQSSDADIYALGDCAQVENLVLPYVMPLMQAARALAKTLGGELTAVHYPAMPVGVKTPAFPMAVAPPTENSVGTWDCVGEDIDWKAIFTAADGQILGWVLTGKYLAEKQALTKLLPPLLV